MNTVPEPATPLVDATPAPSWHRPFARIVTTQFVFGLGFSVLSMAPSMLVRSFHADAREVGVATAMVAFGAVSLAPFAGLALDRYGRVALVRLGCLAAAVAMVGFALTLDERIARNVWLFIAGAAFVLVFNGTTALVADVAPSTHLARAMGWQGASNMVANAVAPTLAEWAAPTIGWKSVFLIGAAVILVAGVISSALVDSRPKEERARSISFEALRAPALAMGPLLVASACAGGAYGSIFSFQQPYMIERGASVVRAYFFGFTSGTLLMRLGFGSLPDRVGHERTSRAAFAAYALVAVGFVLVTPRTLGLGGFLHGVAHGVLYPGLVALAFRRVAPDARGLAASLTNGAFHGGYAASSLGLGALATAFGTAWVFVAGGVLALVAIPFTREPPQRGTSTV